MPFCGNTFATRKNMQPWPCGCAATPCWNPYATWWPRNNSLCFKYKDGDDRTRRWFFHVSRMGNDECYQKALADLKEGSDALDHRWKVWLVHLVFQLRRSGFV